MECLSTPHHSHLLLCQWHHSPQQLKGRWAGLPVQWELEEVALFPPLVSHLEHLPLQVQLYHYSTCTCIYMCALYVCVHTTSPPQALIGASPHVGSTMTSLVFLLVLCPPLLSPKFPRLLRLASVMVPTSSCSVRACHQSQRAHGGTHLTSQVQYGLNIEQ